MREDLGTQFQMHWRARAARRQPTSAVRPSSTRGETHSPKQKEACSALRGNLRPGPNPTSFRSQACHDSKSTAQRAQSYLLFNLGPGSDRTSANPATQDARTFVPRLQLGAVAELHRARSGLIGARGAPIRLKCEPGF